VKALVAKGALGAGAFDTDDWQETYDELSARGVTFLSGPTKRFYGIEATFRDNSGSWFSMSQRTEALSSRSELRHGGLRDLACATCLPQHPRQSEVRKDAAVGEPRYGGDVVAPKGENEQRVRPRDLGLRTRQVAPEGGLAVRARWHQP
jgi:Glyoxalase/Bleomycin resistance protein/Dioxygenase superfamily